VSFNYYDSPDEVGRVVLGGLDLSPLILTAINGCKLEENWKVIEATDASGGTADWRGTKLVESIELTFDAPDRESFAMLDVLWALMAPQTSGAGSAAAPPVTTTTSRQFGSSAPTKPTASASAATTGPKPPTLSIRNPIINRIGVDRVARKSWEEMPAKGCNWQVKATFIQIRPSTPAKTGPADPAKPDDNNATPPDAQTQQIQKLMNQAASL
jgi:hypothetical protein